MTFADFHAAVKALAGAQRCTATVEATTTRDGQTQVNWYASIAGVSASYHYNPEVVLSELRAKLRGPEPSVLEGVDPVPADTRDVGGHCVPEPVNTVYTPEGKPPAGWPEAGPQ